MVVAACCGLLLAGLVGLVVDAAPAGATLTNVAACFETLCQFSGPTSEPAGTTNYLDLAFTPQQTIDASQGNAILIDAPGFTFSSNASYSVDSGAAGCGATVSFLSSSVINLTYYPACNNAGDGYPIQPGAAAGVVISNVQLPTTAASTYQVGVATSSEPSLVWSNDLTITASSPAQLSFTGPIGDGVSQQPFSTQPVVAVLDQYGNQVTGDTSTVSLGITPGTGDPNAHLACSPTAAVAGMATFSGCAIDKVGSYTLTATDGSLTSATSYPFNITPGSASQLAFVGQPGQATVGEAFGNQPAVAVEDAAGNVVTGDASTVSLAIQGGTGVAGAALTCPPTPASSGVATFAGCSIDTVGSGYQLTATDGSLTSATSSPFDVVPGPAASMQFTTEPGSSTGGSAFSVQPVVSLYDSHGDPALFDTSSVQLQIVSGTGTAGAKLTCAPATANAGVATFSGCSIDKAGTGYELKAVDGSLSSPVSSPFDVAVGPAAKLAFTTVPKSAVAAGPLEPQPTVSLEDAGGNVVSSATGTVSLALQKSGAPASGLSCSSAALHAGVASFSGCGVAAPGTGYKLVASGDSLTNSSPTFTVVPGLTGKGLWEVDAAGALRGVGTTPALSAHGAAISHVVGLAVTPTGKGLYEVNASGAVRAYGAATALAAHGRSISHVVGIAVTPDGKGYYEVSSSGAVRAFGDAVLEAGHGSAIQSVVALVPSWDGKGYYEVSSSGAVRTFGDAVSYAAHGGAISHVVSLALTPDGKGYYEVSSTGAVRAYGDAKTYAARTAAIPGVVGLLVMPDGKGYVEVASSGALRRFGDAPSMTTTKKALPTAVVGQALA